jgi:hypothetical protein
VGKSHSVTANLQKMFSQLKSIDAVSCQKCGKKHISKKDETSDICLACAKKEKIKTPITSPQTQAFGKQNKSQKTGQANFIGLKKGTNPINSSNDKAKRISNASKPNPKHPFEKDLQKSVRESDQMLLKVKINNTLDAFNKSKQRYKRLVDKHHDITEYIALKRIPEAYGSTVLKSVANELKVVIQDMDKKVVYIKQKGEILKSLKDRLIKNK